jgi:outer membrane protein OmpA-like peptidoglycan-associated protein
MRPERPRDLDRPAMDGPPPMRRPAPDGPAPIRRPPPPPMREAPNRDVIIRELERGPTIRIAPRDRVTIQEFKRRPELRRAAPSIDIQAINFASGSSQIPGSQYDKVEQIADAMEVILRRNPGEVFLIEGHTDAVGSFASNQRLSEDRAASLRRLLVGQFGIPADAIDTVGYGEEFLLVQTQSEDWRNRRVTIRRAGDFLR